MKPSFGLFAVAALVLGMQMSPSAVAAQEGGEELGGTHAVEPPLGGTPAVEPPIHSDARTAKNVLYAECSATLASTRSTTNALSPTT